jgi:photosystem II stability/assembly factor-like uncharacterized protein
MRLALAGSIVLVAACGGEPAQPPAPKPTTLVVSPATFALASPGGLVSMTVEVLDEQGNSYQPTVPLVPVITSSDTLAVRVVGTDLVGVGPGAAEITVQAAGLTATRQASVGPWPTGPWIELPTSPRTDDLHFMDASFVSPLEGWVVGITGTVHYTADGGLTWQLRHANAGPDPQFFRAAAFVSPTLGWAGDLGFTSASSGPALWETTDGGVSWSVIKDRIAGPLPVGICGMFVIDARTVVGVGRWNGPAVFIRTNDAGATWTSTSLAPLATGAVDLYFFDDRNGIVTAGRGVGSTTPEQQSSRVVILGTRDGGATWEERFVGTSPGQWSWKVSFPTRQVGYVATQGPGGGGVIRTTDGGLTWTELSLPAAARAGGMWGIGFASATHGWVARTHGADRRDPIHDVWETTDGGQTWTRTLWSQGRNVNRFRMFPDGSGFAIASRVFRLPR